MEKIKIKSYQNAAKPNAVMTCVSRIRLSPSSPLSLAHPYPYPYPYLYLYIHLSIYPSIHPSIHPIHITRKCQGSNCYIISNENIYIFHIYLLIHHQSIILAPTSSIFVAKRDIRIPPPLPIYGANTSIKINK